jgi:hypothetical protein
MRPMACQNEEAIETFTYAIVHLFPADQSLDMQVAVNICCATATQTTETGCWTLSTSRLKQVYDKKSKRPEQV